MEVSAMLVATTTWKKQIGKKVKRFGYYIKLPAFVL